MKKIMDINRTKRKSKVKKNMLVTMFCLGFVTLVGCEKKQIFINENDKYVLKDYEDTDLIVDTYYVKDASKFYETYLPNGAEDVFWMQKDHSLIPTLYKNEVIAYASENTELKEISLERYEYLGYSFGIYGCEIDEDGYICFSLEKSIVDKSSAKDELWDAKSTNIRIVAIDDIPVTKEMLSDEGVIIGLEKDKEYTLTIYSGTYYGNVAIKADTQFLEPYETYQIEKAETTKNGYLSISMPDGLKTGYYCINDNSFLKYYDFSKGEKDLSDIDMNEAFYQTEAERIASYSQQYVVSVNEKTLDVGFRISYESGQYEDEEIICYLTSPAGIAYEMPASMGTAYVELAEVISGRWTINVLPKDLEIIDIETISTKKADETVNDEYNYIFETDEENIQFYVSYEGDGDIWGTVSSADGKSQSFELDSKEKKLTTTYTYLPAGSYTVTIYHYADTSIKEVGHKKDEDNENVEVIIIEE